MGNDISRAQILTIGSFAVNFSTQLYGMLTSPNMKEVADRVSSHRPAHALYMYSLRDSTTMHFHRTLGSSLPSSQAKWCYSSRGYANYSLWIRLAIRVSTTTARKPPKMLRPYRRPLSTHPYMRWETFASVSVATTVAYPWPHRSAAGWLFFWLREEFTASQVLVTINTVAQLAAVTRLPPITPGSSRLMVLTHLVAKTFAGIGVLDLLDNGGVVGVRAPVPIFSAPLTIVLRSAIQLPPSWSRA